MPNWDDIADTSLKFSVDFAELALRDSVSSCHIELSSIVFSNDVTTVKNFLWGWNATQAQEKFAQVSDLPNSELSAKSLPTKSHFLVGHRIYTGPNTPEDV